MAFGEENVRGFHVCFQEHVWPGIYSCCKEDIWGDTVTKTLVDIDDAVLKRAQELSGIRTKKGVVAEAMEQLVRRLELDAYTEFAVSEAMAELADPAVIRAAQR